MLWYILAAILALLLFVLFIPLSLSVTVDETGEKTLKGRILGFCVYRSPKRKRRVRLSDYSPRAMERRERKALAKAAKKKKRQTGAQTKQADQRGLAEQITDIADLARLILRRSLYHARVDVESLAITVASSDAAKTALLYGAVSAALAFLTETLDQFSHLRIRKAERYGVAADFSSDRTRADVRLHFRLRVHHLIRIAWHTLLHLAMRNAKKQKR